MKTKSKKWQWVVIVVLGLALLATIGLSMSAAWFQDSDSAGTEAELGHAVTVRLKDLTSDKAVQGWDKIYDSSKTKAYPGDTLIGATRVEMGSTTPAIIRVKLVATVKDSDGNDITSDIDTATAPEDMTGSAQDYYDNTLIPLKKTNETEYATKAVAWNKYLLKTMTDSMQLSSDWTEAMGTEGWRYYKKIYGDTTSKSQSLANAEIDEKSLELFDKLILNPLLTNEVAQWTISLNLRVEAIQAANMDDTTHPWHNDIQGITFSNSYDREGDGTSSGGSGSGSGGGSSVQASPESYFSFDSTTGTITGLQGGGLNETDIVIPASIEGVAVTAIGNSAFLKNTTLETVDFATSNLSAASQTGSQTAARMKTRASSSSGVQTIGTYAFYGCTNLTSITIPNSVTSIGYYAFSDCTGLTEINFYSNASESVASSYGFFYGAGSTEGCLLRVGDNLTKIHPWAFSYSNISSVILPNSVETIGEGAFAACSYLESITIPGSVTSIGCNAFSDKLTLIYYYGTAEDKNEITIDSNFTGGNPTWCYYSANVPATDGDYWHYVDDVLTVWTSTKIFTINGNSITGLSVYGRTLSAIEIPSEMDGTTITAIEAKAFYGCNNLETVTFGEDVQITTIGTKAFYKCIGLTSITIPGSVTSIGNYTFYGCEGVTQINFNATACDDFTENSYVFSGVGTSGEGIAVIFGSGVTQIPAYIFHANYAGEYKKVTSVTIPSSVTSIGSRAFSGCYGLTRVNITDIETWLDISFSYYGSNPLSMAHHLYLNGEEVTELTIPMGKTEIKPYVLSGAYALTSVTIPSSVKTIGTCAFSNCTGLTSISISSGVTIIEDSTFYGCSGLTSITIPSSVTTIVNYAFDYCDQLAYIFYCGAETDKSDMIIGESAFYVNPKWCFYSESEPTTEGNYWYYDGSGVPTVW